MIINKDEQRLLLAIKIIPFVLFCIVAIVGTLLVLYINKVNFENEINKVKTVYLKNEKQIIKQEVTKIRNSIINEKKLTEEKLQKNIKGYVYNAYSIANNIYKENQNKSTEEITKMVIDSLRAVRFNENRGYFFMYKMDGTTLLLPTNKNLEGLNLLDLKDAEGNLSIKDMRDLSLSQGESFYTWWWYKPNETLSQSKKIGFVKYFEPLDLFIGTGEYVKDFEETIKSSIRQRLVKYNYGRDYYFFIFDKEGKIIVHKNENKIGNTSYVFDGLKNKTLKESTEIDDLNSEGNFYQYSFLKYNTQIEDPTTKISYLLKLNDWDWYIGSGFYTDDLNVIINKIKNELEVKHTNNIKNIIFVFFILMFLVILLSLLFSYLIKKRFESYKVKVKEKDQLLFQQSKMAAMGEMIENIAHQWRQPLSIISTTSSGLKVQQEFDIMTEKLLSNGLDSISESVEYLSTTIDDFKNFYKEDKIKQLFNISDTVNKAIHLLHSRFRKKNIEVIVTDSDVEFFGLQNELIQVFMNILNNARDVLENMEIERKLIFVEVLKDADIIQIKFYDNGQGVDKKYLSRLFEYKFTTKKQQNGTGIGLYMSKLIVEKSGGTIKAQNKEYEYKGKNYKGAEFIINFKL